MVAKWRNGGMAEWSNGKDGGMADGMAEWRPNGGMAAEWWDCRMAAEWRDGRMAEWSNGKNGGMVEWQEWRDCQMAEWLNGKELLEWRECLPTYYFMVHADDDTNDT
jgi:hypothetical protein